jgi:bifunctional DNA-binding transcriptional regulator/antitoxin component of YhaV-PrlF toxin-antitoxin module
MERKLFRTGNSLTVTIPPAVAAELGLKAGTSVEVEIDREHDGLLVRLAAPPHSEEAPVTPEFAEWVDGFVDRYGDALRALSRR